jgi:hypothetical protein
VALEMDGAFPRPAQAPERSLFALMHVFFIEKSMTKEKLLAMPADDYMNAEQHAFFEQLLQDMKVKPMSALSRTVSPSKAWTPRPTRPTRLRLKKSAPGW